MNTLAYVKIYTARHTERTVVTMAPDAIHYFLRPHATADFRWTIICIHQHINLQWPRDPSELTSDGVFSKH